MLQTPKPSAPRSAAWPQNGNAGDAASTAASASALSFTSASAPFTPGVIRAGVPSPAASASTGSGSTPLRMPVYDLNGNPIGFLPLAQGYDVSALQPQVAQPLATSPGRVGMGSRVLPPRGMGASLSPPASGGLPPGFAHAAAVAAFTPTSTAYGTALFSPTAPQMPPSSLSAASTMTGASASAASASSGSSNVLFPGTAAAAARSEAIRASIVSTGAPAVPPRPPPSGVASALEGSAAAAQAAASTAAMVTAAKLGPTRRLRDPKDSITSPKDVFVAPTPRIQLAGDVIVPSGTSMVTAQQLVPVGPTVDQVLAAQQSGSGSGVTGPGTAAASSGTVSASQPSYMYSLESTGDLLAELSENRVLQESKIKELEKKLKAAQQKAAFLQKDLDDTFAELDSKDAELRKLKQLEREANRRPDILHVLAGSASSSLAAPHALPVSTYSDAVTQFELLRRLPLLYTLPESVVWELLHRCSVVPLPGGAAVSSLPAAATSMLMVLEGSCAYAGPPLQMQLQQEAHSSSGSGRSRKQQQAGRAGRSASREDDLGYTDDEEEADAAPAAAATLASVGDVLCEHTLLNRQPRSPARDPALWQARVDSLLLVIPSAVLRKLLLSEAALLDHWSEAALSSILSPTYSPLRPAPRQHLHADAEAVELTKHAQLHKSVLHLANGGHVLQAIAAERRGHTASGSASSAGGANRSHHAKGSGEEGDHSGAVMRLGGHVSSSALPEHIPEHLLQNAPLLLHLLTAQLPQAPLERTLQLIVHATARFFGCTAAGFFEYDNSSVIQQEQAAAAAARSAARGAAAGGSRSGTSSTPHLHATAPSVALPMLIPRIVPPHAAHTLNKRMPVTGMAGICANKDEIVNVRDVASDSRLNDKYEPFATPLASRSTMLCVPVHVRLPERMVSREYLCGVLQLVDKTADTSRRFPLSTQRSDEIADETDGDGGAGGADGIFPGAVSVGVDGKPRYAFTSRDEELATFIARKMEYAISASLRQAVHVTHAAKGAPATASAEVEAAEAEEEAAEQAQAATSGSSGSSGAAAAAAKAGKPHDYAAEDESHLLGLGEAHGTEGSDKDREGASTVSTAVASAVGPSARGGAAVTASAGGGAATRTLPLHSITDNLQWRVRSLHAYAPLTSLTTDSDSSSGSNMAGGGYGGYGGGYGEGEDIDGYGYEGGAGAPVTPAKAAIPATALLNGAEGGDGAGGGGGGEDDFGSPGGGDVIYGGGGDATGNGLPAHSPGSRTVAEGGYYRDPYAPATAATSSTRGGGSSSSGAAVYVYVRACIALGRWPVTADASSSAARAVNGTAGGRLGNGAVSGSGEYAPGYGGAVAEGCTANWAVGASTGRSGGHGGGHGGAGDDPSEGRGWIDLDVRVCDIPADSRIVFAVHEEDAGGGGKALFWASAPLFTAAATLRTGRLLLPLYPGAWPCPNLPAADDECMARSGLLEVDLGSVGIPAAAVVVDCDWARGSRWWRGLTMASGLTLDITDATTAGAASSSAGEHSGLSAIQHLMSSPGRGGEREEEEPRDLILDPYHDARDRDAAQAAASAALALARSGGMTPGKFVDEKGRVMSKMAEAARRTADAAAAAAAAAFAARIGYDRERDGLDVLRSDALQPPSLQSGVPLLPPSMNMPPPLPDRQAELAYGRGDIARLRVSPGVADLTRLEIALARAVRDGNAAAMDVWTPHRLSPALRKLMWTYRKLLLTACGPAVLALLLKAAPFHHGVPATHTVKTNNATSDPVLALRAAHAMLAACPLLPPAVALQLLDGGFADSAIRSFAVQSLLAQPLPSLMPLLPAMAVATAWEGKLDTPLTRALLTAAVEAPYTVGRQLLWALTAQASATGLRSRSLRLARAILDVADEAATAEAALQSFALSQLAAAVRRGTLAAARGNRTAALRSALTPLVMPHTLRLPIRPAPPVIPSVYYAAQKSGLLAGILAKLLAEATGTEVPADAGAAAAAAPAAASPQAQAPLQPREGPSRADRLPSRPRSGTNGTDASAQSKSTGRGRGTDTDTETETETDTDTDTDTDGEDRGGRHRDSSKRTRAKDLSLIRDIEDGISLGLVSLGIFSDAAALGLPLSIAADPSASMEHLLQAAEEQAPRRDARLPMAAGLRALVQPLHIDESGNPAPALPFPAAVAQAVQTAVAVVARNAPKPLTEEERTLIELGLRAERTPAPPKPVTVVPPTPAGISLPFAGLCVGSLLLPSCRVLYSNSRRRYSRALLAFSAVRDMDETAADAAVQASGKGIPATARRSEALALASANVALDGIRAPGPTATVTATADAGATKAAAAAAASGKQDSYSDVVRLRAHVPRPIRFRDNTVHVLAVSGEDGVIMAECLHAAIFNRIAATWREAGLPLGDAAPLLAYGVHTAHSRDAVMTSATAAAVGQSLAGANSVGGAGGPLGLGTPLASLAGDAVGSRLMGLMLAPPRARTVAEILNVGEDDVTGALASNLPLTATSEGFGGFGGGRDINDAGTVIDDASVVGSSRGGVDGGGRGGYGNNGLQRWFMSNLFNRFAVSRPATAASGGRASSRKRAAAAKRRATATAAAALKARAGRGGSYSEKKRETDEDEDDEEEDSGSDYSGSDSDNDSGADSGSGASEDEEEGGAYASIVKTYMRSLAAAIVASYVLALGERKPADLMLCPSGHVHLSGLAFTDGVPDRALHTDDMAADLSSVGGIRPVASTSAAAASASAAASAPKARFASRHLLADLLAVLGAGIPVALDTRTGAPTRVTLSPLAAEMLTVCTDAFMAIRSSGQELVSLLASHMPLGIPGAASPLDIAAMRSRLMLHLPDAEASLRFTQRLLTFLCLDSNGPVSTPATLSSAPGASANYGASMPYSTRSGFAPSSVAR